MVENGIHFSVDVKNGQKTGFLLDQKENRAAIAPLCPGARVLDCFCHNGSFSLHAAKYGAGDVLGVDISEEALEVARGNAEMNGLENVRFEAHNCFDHLRELTDEGAKIFAEATAANLGKTISITLDGETISRATVNTVIAGGNGEITGNFTADEAKNLATLILSGALPLNLTQLEVSAISATLGVEALDRAIQAGIIGVALVMLFMLFRYRLCGLVADIALTIYIMIVVLLLALTGAQLTLPGVAGIILGIGMAVDANVVIFERIREEVKNGRPIGSAVRKGFSNALSAIIDSNVTTIIAAVVLYAFGTGSVRGFALTLGIGVATSLVTAVFVTHKLLDIFADLGIKNQKLYV